MLLDYVANTMTGIANTVASVLALDSSESVKEEEVQACQKSRSITPTIPSQPIQKSPQSHQDPTKKVAVILLLGASGSGKTLFFERTFAKKGHVREDIPLKPTTDILTKSIPIGSCEYTLIDTPGFDNSAMTDLESFTKLAKYLINNTQDGITGIIYIQRAGDRLRSKALIQSMRVFSEVFLGRSGLSRLTIMVIPDGSRNTIHASMEQAIPCSEAFHAACDRGARVIVATLEQRKIDKILNSYASKPSILLRIQRQYLEHPQASFTYQIEQSLGCYERDQSNDLSHVVEAQLKEKDSKIRLLESSLNERDLQISQVLAVHTQVEQQLARNLETTLKLQQEHEKTQNEYASLRSQLQLQENIEQSEIVQTLKDLNRDIDSIGRSISEYLVENYIQKTFGKDATEITALNAVNLSALAEPFGCVKGRSSLIASSSGIGMPVEDFLDYAIRSLICGHLQSMVFEPFHPGVHPLDSDFMAKIYADVREREAQAVAGKWRTDSFMGLYKSENEDEIIHRIETITLDIVRDRLDPLITCFFGQEAGIQLSDQYLKRLTQLVQTAWEWNAMLKGTVIMLGDFSTTFYPPASSYDPILMSEFEPRVRSQPPRSILGTLALGLMCSRSLGHGQVPEVTVVYKAMVATRNLYE